MSRSGSLNWITPSGQSSVVRYLRTSLYPTLCRKVGNGLLKWWILPNILKPFKSMANSFTLRTLCRKLHSLVKIWQCPVLRSFDFEPFFSLVLKVDLHREGFAQPKRHSGQGPSCLSIMYCSHWANTLLLLRSPYSWDTKAWTIPPTVCRSCQPSPKETVAKMQTTGSVHIRRRCLLYPFLMGASLL